jgi:hypothetical protein
MASKGSTIIVAVIGAVALIVAAAVGAILQPSWWRSDSTPAPRNSSTIAGRVVDQRTNVGVGQASVSIVGRPETDVTVDDGNFRINLQAPAPKEGTVRIHVAKTGYAPSDVITTPTETLIVQLRQK